METKYSICDITFIIKTFERENAVRRLLNSIRSFYPNNPIIICDDSLTPYSKKFSSEFADLDISVIETEFDIGISLGRNILVNAVKTPLFLLCDDDAEISSRTNLQYALDLFNEHHLDILAGDDVEFIRATSSLSIILRKIQASMNLGVHKTFTGSFSIQNNILYQRSNTHIFYDYFECDIVGNAFIANTKKIQTMGGWDPDFKIKEHEDFFLRAKSNNLRIANSSNWGFNHWPETTSKEYAKARNRNYETLFLEKYNLQKWENELDDFSRITELKQDGTAKSHFEYKATLKGQARRLYYFIRRFI